MWNALGPRPQKEPAMVLELLPPEVGDRRLLCKLPRGSPRRLSHSCQRTLREWREAPKLAPSLKFSSQPTTSRAGRKNKYTQPCAISISHAPFLRNPLEDALSPKRRSK